MNKSFYPVFCDLNGRKKRLKKKKMIIKKRFIIFDVDKELLYYSECTKMYI